MRPITLSTPRPAGVSSRLPGPLRHFTLVALAVALAGCASTAVQDNFNEVQGLSRKHLGAEVKWLTSDEARRQANAETDALLAKPLGGDDAVRIALAYSPALQAMLYESAAQTAQATQSARLPNPVFEFERMVRSGGGEREVEIGRLISFSVLDLILLPSRLRRADDTYQANRLSLAGKVVQAATEARQAWVQAVAAQQSLQYAEQVKKAADASAELARRMHAVGNFSKLQRAREQAFSAEAVAQLARARQAAVASREALVRALGLNDQQAAALKLPDRLPDLPAAPRDETSVLQAGLDQRLDVRLARASLDVTAREQGLTRITSFVNGMEIGIARNSESGEPPQKGFVVELPLPIFDFGDSGRTRAQATYMSAVQRTAALAVTASSQVREGYGAYRTAYDLARHYRDEIVPLRKTISEENLLRYNGMFIGVFELLADAREQIGSVIQAIDAQRDFWLADAALQATLIGRPTGGPAMEAAAPTAGAKAGAAH
ncbi:TolC family protein [Rhizobacter sp. J219]|uniref:TolC family protein n=1 Tax=Rhizobacter sp. J219 TaxID=2898430 RepID=UPI0021510C25|nr:TolC family protein [Rhizobacter sp. J219]MCR5882293.1 TolC family protein [Rhizobacter sp. J219]